MKDGTYGFSTVGPTAGPSSLADDQRRKRAGAACRANEMERLSSVRMAFTIVRLIPRLVRALYRSTFPSFGGGFTSRLPVWDSSFAL